MPWTIPDLLLHDKPVRLANMRLHGRNHVFVNCGNADCYHNTELDVSRFPDDVTFSDSHACSAQSAIIAAPTLARLAADVANDGKRRDVDAFTSHIHLMRPPSGGLFVCAGLFAFATPRDDGAPPTNGGRRGFASFARGPAWNRMCQIAPTVGLAY
jgi:hypothetical protein